MKAGEYRNIGSHPYEVRQGENVQMLGPGDFVELDEDDVKDDDNKMLFADGVLLNTDKQPTGKATKPEDDK